MYSEVGNTSLDGASHEIAGPSNVEVLREVTAPAHVEASVSPNVTGESYRSRKDVKM